MAELADRIPGNTIFASYANEIRDRAVMRYLDVANRDASVPIPITGDLAFLTTTTELQIYDGVAWLNAALGGGGPFPIGFGSLNWVNNFVNLGATLDLDNGTEWKVKYDVGAGLLTRLVVSDLNTNIRDEQGLRVFTIDRASGIVMKYKSATSDGLTVGEDHVVGVGSVALVGVGNDGPWTDMLVSGGTAFYGTMGSNRPGLTFGAYRRKDPAGTAFVTEGGGNLGAAQIEYDDSGATGGLIFRVNNALSTGDNMGGVLQGQGNVIKSIGSAGASGGGPYGTTTGQQSPSMRDILIGTTVPSDAWGKDGDIYIRFS